LLYFEISLYLLLVLVIASFFVAVKYKRYSLIPIVSLILFSAHAVIEGSVNKVGLGGLIGWTIILTALVSMCSYSVWMMRRKSKN